jgi:hypothetical protein
LIINQHPVDPVKNRYDHFLEHADGQKFKMHIDHHTDPYRLIHLSDAVAGMFSMFLLEAAMLGKPIQSIMIGLKRKNPFVLARKNCVKSCVTGAELFSEMETLLSGRKTRPVDCGLSMNAVENIVDQVKHLLNTS